MTLQRVNETAAAHNVSSGLMLQGPALQSRHVLHFAKCGHGVASSRRRCRGTQD